MLTGSRIEIDVSMSQGKTLAFTVDAGAKRQACFALGVRKSGSSVFANVVKAIADYNKMQTVDVAATMFEEGYRYADWNGQATLKNVLWKGNMYLGFRDAPTIFYNDPIFKSGKKILLVRDPRDALVSEYFSNAYSHSIPKNGEKDSIIAIERENALRRSIEDYVLQRVSDLDRTVAAYRPLLADQQLLILRYEDVILNKADWIRQIARHFELETSEQLIRDIVGWSDQRPEVENEKAFVRRVTPGDHRDKLSKKAIAAVESSLSGLWSELGYDFSNK